MTAEQRVINQALTEAMGEKWHKPIKVQSIGVIERFICTCDTKMKNISWPSYYNMHLNNNNNFFTWEGFGKLWEWSQKQDWWSVFLHEQWQENISYVQSEWFTHLIDPTKFAEAVYEHLVVLKR